MNEEVKIEGNTEINQALKEFEEKSEAEKNSYKAVKFYNETDTPKIVQLTMKLSGAKDQKQAEYLLLGFVVLCVGISLFFIFRGKLIQQNPSPRALEQMKQMQEIINQ
ncbi:MAG: hypothetical protein WC671_03295 [Candidatus Paceibacterota bacterium]|jgi:hypothetical protein